MAAVVAVLRGHWVGLCQEQPECELHERPAELPKAPMGTAVSFSCFICIRSVGINPTWYYLKPWHRRILGSPPPRDASSAELCFALACEHGQMGRESQRRRMKGSNQSCGHHSLVATGHLLGPMSGTPSGLKEGTLTSNFSSHLQRSPCLQILHSFMHLQHPCLQWVCRS